MTERDGQLPPPSGDRSVLGCRVSDDVQSRFAKFVDEHLSNRRGAYGYAVEKAMMEYMDNDRYARIDDELSDLRETVNETNAMVRRIITAEKEKGAFLEAAPTGNQAGDRVERENAVTRELVRKCVTEDHPPEYKESALNGVIAKVANVSSEPTKRDYRESLIDRGMLGQQFENYKLTEAAFELAGYQLQGDLEP